jgi:hypothetical protein
MLEIIFDKLNNRRDIKIHHLRKNTHGREQKEVRNRVNEF